ncbi:MAG: hypothetical protein M3253_03290 [Chloroflexota bacterium]|nr:hypothetical protein [Chloroflexota bacterium]
MTQSAPPRVTVEVPASSANLGVGFDALALALEMRLRVTVEALADGPSRLVVHGEGEGRITLDDSNRFLVGLRRGLAEANHPAPESTAWRIEMNNEIPLARGLGSSAAATVAGLLVAQVFGRARRSSAC